MVSKNSSRVTSLKSFWTFTYHFLHYCYVLRGILGVMLLLVILGGIGFARCEGRPISQGVYFSLITSTTVGYGDITPHTGIGQCISVFLALIGTIFFGLVVAVATQAFTVTIHEYLHARGDAPGPQGSDLSGQDPKRR
jgi:voltage-gated potassium channel